MKKFTSIRNQQVAELISKTEDQAVLKMENGDEKSISIATLKRWWKEMPETQTDNITITEEVIAEETDLQQIADENSSGPLQIGEIMEIIEVDTNIEAIEEEQTLADPIISAPVDTLIEKPKKTPKKKSIDTPHALKKVIEDLAEELGTQVTTATIDTFKSLKVNGKRYGAFTFTEDLVTLWLYSDAIEGMVEYRKINHILDARVKFENADSDSIDLINRLIKRSLEYVKNTKKFK